MVCGAVVKSIISVAIYESFILGGIGGGLGWDFGSDMILLSRG